MLQPQDNDKIPCIFLTCRPVEVREEIIDTGVRTEGVLDPVGLSCQIFFQRPADDLPAFVGQAPVVIYGIQILLPDDFRQADDEFVIHMIQDMTEKEPADIFHLLCSFLSYPFFKYIFHKLLSCV